MSYHRACPYLNHSDSVHIRLEAARGFSFSRLVPITSLKTEVSAAAPSNRDLLASGWQAQSLTTSATWPVHSDSPVQSPDGLDPKIIGTPKALNWPHIRDLDEAPTRCVRRRSPNYDDWDASAGGARSARITLDGRLLYFVRRAHLTRVEAIVSLVALPIKLNPPHPAKPFGSIEHVPDGFSNSGGCTPLPSTIALLAQVLCFLRRWTPRAINPSRAIPSGLCVLTASRVAFCLSGYWICIYFYGTPLALIKNGGSGSRQAWSAPPSTQYSNLGAPLVLSLIQFSCGGWLLVRKNLMIRCRSDLAAHKGSVELGDLE